LWGGGNFVIRRDMYHALNLRRLAEIYAVATGQSLREIGRQAAGAHGFFYRLDSKRTCTFRTTERVQQFFEAHWPEWLGDLIGTRRPGFFQP